jgi:4-diphosphocytidyl-2-C-methyl-D-erythritol kinase
MNEMISYAKINLFLEITGKNQNLHKLYSLFIKINIFDIITAEKSKNFSISYNTQNTIQNDIITRTINVLQKHFPQINYNFHFKIKKNIPIGAGLGGASSNCAQVIKFLLKENNIFVEAEKLFLIGKEIGADVPFFLCDSSQILNGTSTELTKPPFDIPKLFCVIIYPKIQLLTKDVFAKVQAPYSQFCEVTSFNEAILRKNEMQEIANEITNGAIAKALQQVKHKNALSVKMSGSGCACFAIFEDESYANECFENVDKENFLVFNTKFIV